MTRVPIFTFFNDVQEAPIVTAEGAIVDAQTMAAYIAEKSGHKFSLALPASHNINNYVIGAVVVALCVLSATGTISFTWLFTNPWFWTISVLVNSNLR